MAEHIHPDLSPIEADYKRAVKRLRDQLTLTQKQFARQFGLTGPNARFTVGRWERLASPHMPSTKHRLRMRQLFEMNQEVRTNPTEFMAGREETSLEQVDFSV